MKKMKKCSILLVEDECIIAMDICEFIRNAGFESVSIAYSGEDAVRKVSEDPPDLILMDIGLTGGLDGVDAAEMIRRIRHIPIIYLSANMDLKTLERVYHTAPEGFIKKPYQEKEVIRVIRDFCDNRLGSAVNMI